MDFVFDCPNRWIDLGSNVLIIHSDVNRSVQSNYLDVDPWFLVNHEKCVDPTSRLQSHVSDLKYSKYVDDDTVIKDKRYNSVGSGRVSTSKILSHNTIVTESHDSKNTSKKMNMGLKKSKGVPTDNYRSSTRNQNKLIDDIQTIQRNSAVRASISNQVQNCSKHNLNISITLTDRPIKKVRQTLNHSMVERIT